MNPKNKPKFRRGGLLRIMKNRTNTAKSWRKPRGIDSKQRTGLRNKPSIPSVGYGAPKKTKYLHPSGLAEVLVFNVSELKNLDPKKNCVRIGSKVGKLKRIFIQDEAKKLGLNVLNQKKLEVKKAKKKAPKKEETPKPEKKEEPKKEKKEAVPEKKVAKKQPKVKK